MKSMYKSLLYVCLFKVVMTYWYQCDNSDQECECEKSAVVCETSLIVENRLLMVDYSSSKALVHPSHGKLYKFSNSSYSELVPTYNVITGDGWYNTSRMVVVVNGTMPAPPLIFYQGQQLVINVVNKLHSEQLTIHWHGLDQKGWAFMDGVPFLTQCPIETGQSFLYNFPALPTGTYWYHSHMGNQRSNGLFGALIIREKDPLVTIKEHILTIIEWNHNWNADVDLARVGVQFTDQDPAEIRESFHSGLINGKGRYNNNGAPLEIYNVTQGQKYRFRVIGAGTLYPWEISIDQHRLTVIATDGVDIDPITVDSIIVHPAERYDFILNATKISSNYWIRGKILQPNLNFKADEHISARAHLHYADATMEDPTSLEDTCTSEHKCLVLNCGFLYFPETENKSCLTYRDIKGIQTNDTAQIKNTTQFQEFFLNFGFPGTTFSPPSINGHQFIFPKVAALADPQNIDTTCDNADCGEQKICTCSHSISLKANHTVQVVLLNMGMGRSTDGHPIHIHGHTFSIVKVGFGTYNMSTGQLIGQNEDIDCQGGTTKDQSFCNNPTWSNLSWLHGNLPGLELDRPVGKDTIIVPRGGYVVLRFIADNPGVWFVHCHIDKHMMNGMALMINESFPNQDAPPSGFPRCHSFPFTSSLSQSKEGAISGAQDNTSTTGHWIGIGILIFIVVVLIVIIFWLLRTNNQSLSVNQTEMQHMRSVET